MLSYRYLHSRDNALVITAIFFPLLLRQHIGQIVPCTNLVYIVFYLQPSGTSPHFPLLQK